MAFWNKGRFDIESFNAAANFSSATAASAPRFLKSPKTPCDCNSIFAKDETILSDSVSIASNSGWVFFIQSSWSCVNFVLSKFCLDIFSIVL